MIDPIIALCAFVKRQSCEIPAAQRPEWQAMADAARRERDRLHRTIKELRARIERLHDE
jgi:hypothetical protein